MSLPPSKWFPCFNRMILRYRNIKLERFQFVGRKRNLILLCTLTNEGLPSLEVRYSRSAACIRMSFIHNGSSSSFTLFGGGRMVFFHLGAMEKKAAPQRRWQRHCLLLIQDKRWRLEGDSGGATWQQRQLHLERREDDTSGAPWRRLLHPRGYCVRKGMRQQGPRRRKEDD
jgi:hypothetical protein